MVGQDNKEVQHFVYMLTCGDGTIYSGYSTNPQHRCAQHNRGKGAKYTRSRLPVELAYIQQLGSKSEALRSEAQLKKLSRGEKLKLIEAQKEQQ